MAFVNIGHGNLAESCHIVTVISSDSNPAKRIIRLAKEKGKLIDATQGRRTRSVLIMDSDHIILSSVQPETIDQRVRG